MVILCLRPLDPLDFRQKNAKTWKTVFMLCWPALFMLLQYQASKWAGDIESGSTVQDLMLKSVNPSSCPGRGQLVKSETKDRPWWATAQACQKKALQQANQLLVLKLHFFAKKVHDTVQVVLKLQNISEYHHKDKFWQCLGVWISFAHASTKAKSENFNIETTAKL